MNISEKKIIQRLNDCLKIPAFTGGGTQSTSLYGTLKYAHDCKTALPKIRQILTLLLIGESYDGEIKEDLCELEKWIAERNENDWQ